MANKIDITYCGHSTVIINTEENKKVIVDAFLSGNPLCPAELKEPEVDIILLTHGHADHASDAAPLAQKTGAQIFATYELAMLMIKEGVPESQVAPMNKGGTAAIPNSQLSVTLTDAFHSSSYDASDGNTYYAGEACGVVLTLESGRTLYHAGDTSLFSDMKLIAEEYQPSIAFIPIGDCFTMGPKEAAKATALIKPNTVIPIHHSTFPLLTGTPEEFGKCVQELGIDSEVLNIEVGESVEV